jgi:predicted dienelactone hydrolase
MKNSKNDNDNEALYGNSLIEQLLTDYSVINSEEYQALSDALIESAMKDFPLAFAKAEKKGKGKK